MTPSNALVLPITLATSGVEISLYRMFLLSSGGLERGQRSGVCVCVCEREREKVCVYVCVCVLEKERGWLLK